MNIFDSHAHLDMKYSKGEVAAMLERAWRADLVGIIAIAGANKALDFGFTLELASSESRVWATAGIHPHGGSSATPDALDKLRFALDHPRVMALGEIGLDYHYNHSPPAEQRRAFVNQMRLAHRAFFRQAAPLKPASDAIIIDTTTLTIEQVANEVMHWVHQRIGH